MKYLKVQVEWTFTSGEKGGGGVQWQDGGKLEYLEKTPDSQSKNHYQMLEKKICHPSQEPDPNPLALILRSLNQRTWLA